MDLMIKAVAAAVTAIVACLLIKRSNPELSAVLSICTVVIILFSAVGMSDGLQSIRRAVKQIYGSTDLYMAPVMKCLGISIACKIGCDICKDSSQGAAASALELTAAVSALSIAAPMIINLLKIIGGLN